jgi:hypothetical protein
MCRNLRLLVLCAIILACGAIFAAQAAPRQGPCADIVAACQQAGFVRGGGKAGNGLIVHCVRPIMQATAQPRRASLPLPQVDAQLVDACKSRNPNFGQRNARPGPNVAPLPSVEPAPSAGSAPDAQSRSSAENPG